MYMMYDARWSDNNSSCVLYLNNKYISDILCPLHNTWARNILLVYRRYVITEEILARDYRAFLFWRRRLIIMDRDRKINLFWKSSCHYRCSTRLTNYTVSVQYRRRKKQNNSIDRMTHRPVAADRLLF